MKGDFTNFDEASRRHWESMSDPIVGPGQGIEAVKHLRRLTKGGCKELDADRESVCRWCRSSTTFEDADGRRHFLHEPDCAFAHALDFLDQLNTPTAEQHR
jgi:hypothetical protein